MRPIRLEVEGFTCYRDRQPPLDFSELSLFAIAGPTGAGKSSILDTMLYALYGEVPRIGKHGISEVISQGRDGMSVALDFACGSALSGYARVEAAKAAPQKRSDARGITAGSENEASPTRCDR